MSATSTKPAGPGRKGERGYTVLEVLSSLAIMGLALASIHLTVGTAVRSRLLASSWMANQSQGRLAVSWIADRVRQAGILTTPGHPVPACRDAIVVEDAALRPTAAQLYVSGDIDNDGAPETHGFRIAAVGGVNALVETSIACVSGAPALDAPLTDPASVEARGLQFRYFDVGGAELVPPLTDAQIRQIYTVRVTVDLRANAGAQGPRDQTWTTLITLRNR